MKYLLCFSRMYLAVVLIGLASIVQAQFSSLINFGSTGCTSTPPSFSIIRNPLTASPSVLTTCNMATQLPDYFSVFIAYNPKDNQIYVADIRDGINTKIWKMDMGLPGNIVCPTIPTAPNYSYTYVSNNFEFDNNGDLWSFSNYNVTTGRCNIDKFDVNTGNVLSSKVLQFPAGNFPTAITSGDLTILPNGRMFATLGAFPSRLYEITNYSTPGGTATAIFLQTLPLPCYGIAYLNGELEVTGTDLFSTCYYYRYNISANTLSAGIPFQNNQLPIDNSSFTPSLGVTKRLVAATRINGNTADLVYELYARNLGNMILNNVNISEKLGDVFGAANISNVSIAFEAGGNPANLVLNPSYNGTSEPAMLAPNQNLRNQTATNLDYFVKLRISLRVTNLNTTTTYFNSAIATATIGSTTNGTRVLVTDSSNNGTEVVVDPNNNGNATEFGENIPTPFNFGAIPVRFIGVQAQRLLGRALGETQLVRVSWQVATPTYQADFFDVEFSLDGVRWTSISRVPITDNLRGRFEYTHHQVPDARLLYRIRQVDLDGRYIYSPIAIVGPRQSTAQVQLFPNPARDWIQVLIPASANRVVPVRCLDAAGRVVKQWSLTGGSHQLPISGWPAGTYWMEIRMEEKPVVLKWVKGD